MPKMTEARKQERKWMRDYLSSLEGATITGVTVRSEDDGFGFAEDWPVLKVTLRDGSKVEVEVSQDTEGNGAGFLFGLPTTPLPKVRKTKPTSKHVAVPKVGEDFRYRVIVERFVDDKIEREHRDAGFPVPSLADGNANEMTVDVTAPTIGLAKTLAVNEACRNGMVLSGHGVRVLGAITRNEIS